MIVAIAAVLADHFAEKDTRFNRNRRYTRSRHLRRVLIVLASVMEYRAGQSATGTQQAEVQAQRLQLLQQRKNIEALAGGLGIKLPTPRIP